MLLGGKFANIKPKYRTTKVVLSLSTKLDVWSASELLRSFVKSQGKEPSKLNHNSLVEGLAFAPSYRVLPVE